MAVFRINKTRDYTVMSNHHLKDRGLSLKSKGLLSIMLSLPDDWDYSISGLCTICVENESAIKSALNELKKRGYLRVDKIMPDKTETGRIEYEYNIFEQPYEIQCVKKQGIEKQGIENQGVENQPLEIQGLENQGQLNTKKSSTKESNTKKSNTDNKEIYTRICSRLNEKAGTNYRPTSAATQRHINARLAEGFTVEDFIKVIDVKCAEWAGTDMGKYLRPETLFGNKFENYLNQQTKQQKSGQTQSGYWSSRAKELGVEPI